MNSEREESWLSPYRLEPVLGPISQVHKVLEFHPFFLSCVTMSSWDARETGHLTCCYGTSLDFIVPKVLPHHLTSILFGAHIELYSEISLDKTWDAVVHKIWGRSCNLPDTLSLYSLDKNWVEFISVFFFTHEEFGHFPLNFMPSHSHSIVSLGFLK